VSLVERLRKLPGVEEAVSRFTQGPAFRIDGREFVHFHGDEVEIRLTRRLIRELDDPRVYRRTPHSEWVGVPVAEEELALDLAARAREANGRK
jgi:hypothetical protein